MSGSSLSKMYESPRAGPRGPRRASARGPRRASAIGTAGELVVGAGLLATAALAGLAFVHHPWPNRLDVWGYEAFPADTHARWAVDAVRLGSVTPLLVGVLAIFLVGMARDWVRAAAAAMAPLAAVLIVQDLAKPLVGRHLGLSSVASYPSGTVAAVAALATAATLVVPRLGRPIAVLVGAMATVVTVAAVVVLRWHYPTDALGGAAVGVGAVLALDALLHLPWVVANMVRPGRSGHTSGTRASAHPAFP